MLSPPYPVATQILNSFTISVIHKCDATFPAATSLPNTNDYFLFLFHVLIDTKFKHATSTYYHS